MRKVVKFTDEDRQHAKSLTRDDLMAGLEAYADPQYFQILKRDFFDKRFLETERGHPGSISKFFEDSRRLIGAAPVFDFADAGFPSKEHTDFTFELLSKGVYQLPYETVVVRTSFDGVPGALWFVITEGMKSSFITQIFYYSGIQTEGQPELAFVGFGKADNRGDVRMIPVPRFNDTEIMHLQAYMIGALSLFPMLMSPGVEVDTHTPSDDLQKARERKGKPPLPEKHIVRINFDSESARRVHHGGTHASPRPHWRRGHQRKYKRTGLVIPIPPTIVGASGPVPAIGKRMYEAVKSRMHGKTAA